MQLEQKREPSRVEHPGDAPNYSTQEQDDAIAAFDPQSPDIPLGAPPLDTPTAHSSPVRRTSKTGVSHKQITLLQRRIGNRQVERLLQTQQPSPAASSVTEDGALQRWTNPILSFKSDKELLEAALNEHDTAALKQVTDFSSINLNQTLQLIDLLNSEDSVWGRDARAMRLLWSSIGADFEVVASKDGGARWKTSLDKVPSLSDDIPQAKAIKDRFPKDVNDIVSTILEGNRTMVMSEMQGLGIPLDASASAEPMSDAQRDRMSDMQIAAERLARFQKIQEAARNLQVGWRAEQTSGAPPVAATGPEGLEATPTVNVNSQIWYPVEFDPFKRPPYSEAPAPRLPYIIVTPATIQSYDKVKEEYDLISTFIELTLNEFPELFGVVRDKSSDATKAFSTQSPEAARNTLGKGLRKTIEDIERTQTNLGGKLDLLDLTPIHAKMFSQGLSGAGSPVIWNHPAPASIARQLVKDHDFNRALQAMAFDTATQALIVLAPLAGPGALFVMLAVVTAEGAKAVMSADRFEAMATAARSSAKPGSDIVSAASVDDAEKEKKADEAAVTLSVMLAAIAGAVGGFGITAQENGSPLEIAARAEARRILNVVKTEEPSVTATLEGAAEKGGGKLEGREHMLKTEESLARKLHDRAAQLPTSTTNPDQAVQSVSAKINDALRYTLSVEPDSYLKMKQQTFEVLRSKGYTLEWEWNAWGDPKTPYRGVNSTWRTANGQLFEVQFHTAESYSVKSSPLVRAMYEEARAAGTSPERRAELEKLMYEQYGVVVPPPGVEVKKP